MTDLQMQGLLDNGSLSLPPLTLTPTLWFQLASSHLVSPPSVSWSQSASVAVSPPTQVQLIHDSTSPTSPATPATPLTPASEGGAQTPGSAQVQMTWTEKADGEPAKPPGAATPEGIKDIFNMKP